MKEVTRKDFLKGGAVVAAGAAGAAIPFAAKAAADHGTLAFSASAGVPHAPLPNYATHVVEGQIDLTRGTGLVTTRVLAGHPEGGTSLIGLPGLARMFRVTEVRHDGPRVLLSGVAEDRSQLQRGESHQVEIVVDRKKGLVLAPFLGRQIEHRLAA